MKVVAVLFSSVALLGAAVAQDYDSLPACGKTCISNLLGDAPAFGCSTTNEASCLCANETFTYGIRDCSNEACDNSANAASVVNYGIAYCSSAGVAIPTTVQTVTSGSASATTTGSASGTGAGSSATGSGGGAVAISTSSFLTTITTDGSTITSSAASTIFSSGAASSLSGAASSLSGAASSLSGAASSVAASASSEASAAASSAGGAASSAGSAASSAASGTASGSSSSAAFAPQMTAAPIGFLAAAGVAVMLL